MSIFICGKATHVRDMMPNMNILESAIKTEGSVSALAKAIDVKQNVISNWRNRGTPKPWEMLLSMRYKNTTPTPKEVA